MKAILSSYRLWAFSLVLLILTGVPLKAQTKGVLWGEVADTASGAPVAGATVKVQLESDTTFVRYTYTNAVGKYRFGNLQVGKYRVTYSMLGYSPVVTEAQVGDADPTMMRIVLAEEPLRSQDIVVTASRHEEKATHAPASVSTISSTELREHVSATPTEALANVPGIDVGHEGIAMSTYSSRSMHSVFGSDVLTMNDYHSMEVPSIGGFYGILMPQINEDIDHIEVVRGPGSALYGPDAATGVVHIISKSPFSSQGTNLSVSGGERGYFDGGFRHAQAFGDNFAVKVSGHYLKANDWQMAADPKEDQAKHDADSLIGLGPATLASLKLSSDSLSRIGNRDYSMNVYSVEARAEAILSDNTTLNITGGLTNIGNQIAMSEDFGGAQIKDWMYDFVQARLNYKDLFIQGAVNHNDTKGSYFLPTGAPIVNRSSTYVAQIQHQYAPMSNEKLTYGADYQAIRPISAGTIYGPDDGHADVNIFGIYLQSQTSLLDDQLEIVLAGRYDKHSYLKDPIISPRGAIVYHLNEQHLVRAMYNNTYLFPTENSLYGDLLFRADAFGFRDLGLTSAPFGISPINIRYVTPYVSGLNFVHSSVDPSSYDMHTVFAPGAAIPASQATGILFGSNGGALWSGLMSLAAAKLPAPLAAALQSIGAPSTEKVGSYLGYLNLHASKADHSDLYIPVKDGIPTDIAAVKPQQASTMELDYQGSLSANFQVEVDAYQTHYDAIRASAVALTPNVLVNAGELVKYLADSLTARGLDAQTATLVAQGVASKVAGLPLGVVQPTGGAANEARPTDILIGTRNYLENSVQFMGLDASFNEKASDIWSFTGSISWLNKNYWYAGELNSKDSSLQTPFALNMPKYRASISAKYSGLSRGLSLELRDRWSDAFKMDDSYWVGDIGARHVLDLTVNYHPDAEAWKNLNVTLAITNLLDNKHQELVGAPFIGRLTVLRAAYTLPSL